MSVSKSACVFSTPKIAHVSCRSECLRLRADYLRLEKLSYGLKSIWEQSRFTATYVETRWGSDEMPERVERYRLNADKCHELAQKFKDPDAKRTMLEMADAWLMLAAQCRTTRRPSRAQHGIPDAGNPDYCLSGTRNINRSQETLGIFNDQPRLARSRGACPIALMWIKVPSDFEGY